GAACIQRLAAAALGLRWRCRKISARSSPRPPDPRRRWLSPCERQRHTLPHHDEDFDGGVHAAAGRGITATIASGWYRARHTRFGICDVLLRYYERRVPVPFLALDRRQPGSGHFR